MKNFNLGEAKMGEPVCTRDGHSVRILCFDAKNREYPIIGLVMLENDPPENILTWDIKGRLVSGEIRLKDLMMIGETIEINGYKVPAPETEPLKANTNYFVPLLDRCGFYKELLWDDKDYNFINLERGIVHLTKEAAIEHAKALLSFT